MDFRDVVRRRKMVRTFTDRPIDREAVARILDHFRRGPSAGYTQGVACLVLEGPAETARFWNVIGGDGQEWPHDGLRRAPLIVVPLASKQAYLDRYAEPDKGWIDRAESRWPVPYWEVDAAFASMLVLLSPVNEGLGALFFGLPGWPEPFYDAYGVPREYRPIGAIAIGHPAPDPIRSSAHTRPRKRLEEVVRLGSW